MQKFIYNKKNKILICVHAMFDSYQSNAAIEISKNLSDYMLGRFVKHQFDIIIGDNEYELIKHGVDENFYTHAVIIAVGTSMKLSDRLISEIIKKCQDNFFIAGHILDRNEKYYELHHQFYIINLEQYKELNCPFLGDSEKVSHSQIEPIKSKEFIGSDYIPKYITPGSTTKLYSEKMHGWNIISQGLINNKLIIDLGEELRNNKKYFYYEYDPVFISESSYLFYNQFFINNFVCPFNSDGINTVIEFDGPVEQYVSVGTGLNWIKNLEILGYTENTEIIFTDINPLVLIFMKKLISQWDGENYLDFFDKNRENDLPNNLPYDYQYYITNLQSNWEEFLGKFVNWKESWNRIKKLKFKFIPIDYLSNFNLEWLKPNKKTFFNMSDVFNHVPTVCYASVKYRICAENRFLNKIRNFDENIILRFTGRSICGFQDNILYYGSASEFSLTDINSLSRIPHWHEKDWKSYKILM